MYPETHCWQLLSSLHSSQFSTHDAGRVQKEPPTLLQPLSE